MFVFLQIKSVRLFENWYSYAPSRLPSTFSHIILTHLYPSIMSIKIHFYVWAIDWKDKEIRQNDRKIDLIRLFVCLFVRFCKILKNIFLSTLQKWTNCSRMKKYSNRHLDCQRLNLTLVPFTPVANTFTPTLRISSYTGKFSKVSSIWIELLTTVL